MNLFQSISRQLFNSLSQAPIPTEKKLSSPGPLTFNRLISLGFQPSHILDVGCYLGKWTNAAKEYFPHASFTLIDAIYYPNAEALARTCSFPYHVELLFDDIKRVDWFEEKNSGDSIFRERTAHYASTKSTLRTTTTLDILLGTQKFDLIKIDAQGAEIPILKGGQKLVALAEVIALEIPFCGQYNTGVANFISHINFMDSLGFNVFDISELHYFQECLIQVDIFFVKKTSSILNNVQSLIDGGSWHA